jgi:hypothetical protein
MSVGHTVDRGVFVAGKPRVLLMAAGARGSTCLPTEGA